MEDRVRRIAEQGRIKYENFVEMLEEYTEDVDMFRIALEYFDNLTSQGVAIGQPIAHVYREIIRGRFLMFLYEEEEKAKAAARTDSWM